jgi:cell division protease FtsH
VQKISIVPRGVAALGFTMQMPAEEKYVATEREIRSKLVGLLGGRAAEELVFGDASTGAQNDLQKATDVARAMVTEYGMSERVGLVAVGEPRTVFLRGGATAGLDVRRGLGNELLDAIDQEIARIVREAHDRALALLGGDRARLDRIAGRLLVAEVLEGDELATLLAPAVHDPRRADPGVAA